MVALLLKRTGESTLRPERVVCATGGGGAPWTNERSMYWPIFMPNQQNNLGPRNLWLWRLLNPSGLCIKCYCMLCTVLYYEMWHTKTILNVSIQPLINVSYGLTAKPCSNSVQCFGYLNVFVFVSVHYSCQVLLMNDARTRHFYYSTATRQALGPTQPPISLASRLSSRGYSSQGMKLITQLYLVSRSWTVELYLLSP
jgi:hypothetical protein